MRWMVMNEGGDDVEEMRWSEAMGVVCCGGRECMGGSSRLNPCNDLRLYISIKYLDVMVNYGG